MTEHSNRLAAVIGDVGPKLAPGSLPNLPEDHQRLLYEFNGFTAVEGTCRIFGSRAEPWADLKMWNSTSTWRFAWPSRLSDWFCFGGTAWGDQFAYRIGGSGELDPTMHFLEATELEPAFYWRDFSEFLSNVILNEPGTPHELMTAQALKKFGPPAFRTQWAYAPSLLFGAEEQISNVVELNAITSMVFAGDILTCVDEAAEEAAVAGVQTWRDEAGRDRLRLVFG